MKNFLFFWKKPSLVEAQASELYKRIVTRSLQPKLYTDFGVPDDWGGRLEMLLLHLILVIEALQGAGKSELEQVLVDLCFKEIESCLREKGVGDLSVGKKMRHMGRVYIARTLVYRKSFSEVFPYGMLVMLFSSLFDEAYREEELREEIQEKRLKQEESQIFSLEHEKTKGYTALVDYMLLERSHLLQEFSVGVEVNQK